MAISPDGSAKAYYVFAAKQIRELKKDFGFSMLNRETGKQEIWYISDLLENAITMCEIIDKLQTKAKD